MSNKDVREFNNSLHRGSSVQTTKGTADVLLLEMPRKDKNNQETMGCPVLEVVVLDPLMSPQTLY